MDHLPPPEAATGFLAAPRTLLEIATLIDRDALQGGVLLTGPQGQGKATVAYLIAATLLSGGHRLGEVDAKVQSLVAARAHPDLLTLERTEHPKTGKLRQAIEVDAVRAVIERLHQTSTSGRRVVVVDLADDLGRNAANSLLKMLEEPPRGTCLLLLSLAPSRLLPTIVSRCRRISLLPVDDEPLARWLADTAGIAPDEARRIAEAADGAPGRARRLAAGEGREAAELATRLLDAARRDEDLVPVARRFSGKNAEPTAEEAARLVLGRLGRELREAELSGRGDARLLEAYDEAARLFGEAGTADPAQTALMAGLAIRHALAGRAA